MRIENIYHILFVGLVAFMVIPMVIAFGSSLKWNECMGEQDYDCARESAQKSIDVLTPIKNYAPIGIFVLVILACAIVVKNSFNRYGIELQGGKE